MDGNTETLAKQNSADDSFAGLVKQHQTPLKSFLYRFMTSKEDTEDIAQETFAKSISEI